MVRRADRWGGRGLGLVLAAVLVTACGSGGDTNEAGGSGGGAGAGGTGGAGATGGTGGVLSCDPPCSSGETCVEREAGPACECTAEPSSCPDGQFCNDDLRCEPDWPVVDFVPCNRPEEVAELPDGTRLFCTDYLNPPRAHRWLRLCGGPGDCPGSSLICLGEVVGYNVAPYCMVNRCGIDSLGPRLDPPLPMNGEPFGPCSASSGYLGEGTVADGTCYPQSFIDGTVGGICFQTGIVPKTRPCKQDADRDEPDLLCGADAVCLAFPLDTPGLPCTADAGCAGLARTLDGKTEHVDGYCGKDGTCRPVGFCGDVCNWGMGGDGVHENAGCTDPAGVCADLSGAGGDRPLYQVLEGYCEARCTMFQPDACPEFPAGIQRACLPTFDRTEPLDGKCIDQASVTRAIGDACEDTPGSTECPDGAACLSLVAGEPARCVQWCECEAGFDGSTKVCRDDAASAGCGSAGDACVLAVPGSPIGLCASRD